MATNGSDARKNNTVKILLFGCLTPILIISLFVFFLIISWFFKFQSNLQFTGTKAQKNFVITELNKKYGKNFVITDGEYHWDSGGNRWMCFKASEADKSESFVIKFNVEEKDSIPKPGKLVDDYIERDRSCDGAPVDPIN